MWLCYLIAVIPILVWLTLWVKSHHITKTEAIIPSVLGIITCLLFHGCAVSGMTHDIETWSGHVVSATFEPSYTEWYMQQHRHTRTVRKTRTVGTGKDRRTESYTDTEVYYTYTRETRRVPDRAWCRDTVAGQHTISVPEFRAMESKLGKADKHTNLKDNYDSGNPYTYIVTPKTEYVWPSVTTKWWENRVQASPSIFSFVEVPEGTPGIYEYPTNPNWDRSGRLLGTATSVPILAWDQMNARLGPTKKVNVIAIGFGDKDKSIALLQQAKWIGGKKNDVVICFGGDNAKPAWTFVFGWTEQEIAKRNLETIVLDHGFALDSLPKIEEEIKANYIIKDWSKFDYLDVEPPSWAYWILIIIVGGIQTLCWFIARNNEFTKEGIRRTFRRYY